MDRFRTMFTLVENAYRRHCCCCGVEYQRWPKCVHSPSHAQLEDFAEGSLFASSQNPTRERIKAERLQERHTFGELVQHKIITVPDLHKKILFSDENHFWLNSWSDDNPQAYVETPLNSQK